ncbi:hypothetical protein D3C73_1423370 [compost metagenome]
MKITQIYALVGALVLSSVALAEGGGDRTFAKAMQAQDQAMEKYAAREGKNAPVVSSDAKDETNKEI